MPQHAATNGNHARIHRRGRSSRSAETDIVQFFDGVIGRHLIFRLPGFCTGKLSGRSFRPHIGCGNHLGPRAALPQGSRMQPGNDALAGLRAGVPAEFTDAAECPDSRPVSGPVLAQTAKKGRINLLQRPALRALPPGDPFRQMPSRFGILHDLHPAPKDQRPTGPTRVHPAAIRNRPGTPPDTMTTKHVPRVRGTPAPHRLLRPAWPWPGFGIGTGRWATTGQSGPFAVTVATGTHPQPVQRLRDRSAGPFDRATPSGYALIQVQVPPACLQRGH